jgi:hypothetical protein
VVTLLDGDCVTTSLDVYIPDEMVEKMEIFNVGEVVKIRCNLGYSHDCHQLQLMANLVTEISSVKVVVG